ncbi:hypothetical protein [Adhaeribacter pallidiroseus]|uniref:hypothetical protein n=1 Tax=Adhaeribacter pallidiroseus TaxID=2072847 RepID=UPI001314562F|nr:hypothetical protein [Adhaeribacter pallidiroseus]
MFNNAFGLSGNLGGQTNVNPISLDAIDQIQVQIAPLMFGKALLPEPVLTR